MGKTIYERNFERLEIIFEGKVEPRRQESKVNDKFPPERHNISPQHRGFLSGLKELVANYNYLKFETLGFMALSVDVVFRRKGIIYNIAMAHNYILNGDVVPDPDMEIEINFEHKTAEAISYQDINRYDSVYDFDDEGNKIREYPKLKASLNDFFELWTKNLIAQGHKLTTKER